MNDLMSLGLHRLLEDVRRSRWRGRAAGERVLDVAGGSGDLARRSRGASAPRRRGLAHRHQPRRCSKRGRDRLLDAASPAPAVQCDAERLPFPIGYFDCVTVAFGLRNMTHKDAALAEMARVLQAGRAAGGARVLEGVEAARAAPTTAIRSRCCRWLGAARRGRRSEPIAISPNRSACIRTRRRSKAMMEQAGLVAGRSTSISPPAWSRCIAACGFDSMRSWSDCSIASGYRALSSGSWLRRSSRPTPRPRSAAAARSARSAASRAAAGRPAKPRAAAGGARRSAAQPPA